ncbi:MAG TPA: Maf family protein [Candidatus Eisenbacteria bacterium]|nr:Maf family protein [Candidatus Eisenbacteria bacterium]
MRLILASSSPRRAEILANAGLDFSVISSAVDESPLPGEKPEALVQRLANAKAELVIARAIGPSIIIAADTVVVLDDQILGKPHSVEDARRMLQQLSGRTHSVLTAVALVRLPDAERREFTETTSVHFRPISEEELVTYLDTEEPYDKAGAYAIQGLAGRFIPRIEGCYFNVVGLPLSRVLAELGALGWSGTF